MVKIAATLEAMAGIYALPKEGGPTSPRFRRYVSIVQDQWGIAAYNPMSAAGAATVKLLLDLDAETIAQAAATDVLRVCEFLDDITLALVVRAPGMWTDRIATDVQYRSRPLERHLHGLITVWSSESVGLGEIRRESAAESVRVVWTALHGRIATVRAMLHREGLAYAIAERVTGVAFPEGDLPSAADDAAVQAAVNLLGESEELADVGSMLVGDGAAIALGWTALGLPHEAGCRWAIARAAEQIAALGIPRALRAGDFA